VSDALQRLTAALADSYRIERELGAGAMATVYLAEDLKHHRPVAIKVMRPDIAASLGGERFVREIETAAQLTHPHILTVFDSGEADGFLYYVMPYVEGESLREKLEREGQLPIEEAVTIAWEVADALSFAHERGVIHRDIKPENIMLSAGHAVVADFGIARALSAAGGDRLTETGLAVGTPSYMSPEQASGEEKVDGRSDIYALGCVLFEMLAGEPPYTGPTVQAVIAKRFTEPLPKLGTVRDTVPDALELAVARAAARLPVDRFSSSDEFKQALSAIGTSRATSSGAAPRAPARPSRIPLVVGGMAVAAAIVISAVALRSTSGGAAPDGPDRPMLAVLPFENLGSSDDQYFTDGMVEEITSRLGEIEALGVISRTSAMKYKDSDKPLRQVGEELGVQYVLEGTVRWQRTGGASRVRVTPQLIRVDDDTHLWSDRYDAVLEDVFDVQAEIAGQVAAAMGVTLLASGAGYGDAERPTQSVEAYDYYLRGKSFERVSYSQEDLLAASNMYEQALLLDPDYADAHAALAFTHTWKFWFGYDPSITRLEMARDEVDRALALDSNSSQVRFAAGDYYYHGEGRYDLAIEHLEIARSLQPNNSDLYATIGAVRRRQGKWQETLENYHKVVEELDPLAPVINWEVAYTYLVLRQYEEADRWNKRFLSLAPEQATGYLTQAWLVLQRDGDTEETKRWLTRAFEVASPAGIVSGVNAVLFIELLPVLSEALRADVKRLPAGSYSGNTQYYHLVQGWLAKLDGEQDVAMAHFDSSRVVLEEALAAAPRFGNQVPTSTIARNLALTYAHLGRREDAIRTMELAMEGTSVSRDALEGPVILSTAAQMYTILGDYDEAVELLEQLLAIPAQVSRPYLRANPLWRRLDGHAGFEALMREGDG
jgi:serine/threonine-protein kinase